MSYTIPCACGKCMCPAYANKIDNRKKEVDDFMTRLRGLFDKRPNGDLMDTIYTYDREPSVKVKNSVIYSSIESFLNTNRDNLYDEQWNHLGYSSFTCVDFFSNTTYSHKVSGNMVTITISTVGTEVHRWSQQYEITYPIN